MPTAAAGLIEQVTGMWPLRVAPRAETFCLAAAEAVAVLTRDALWSHLHHAGLATRHGAGWPKIAARWGGGAGALEAR